VFYSSILATFKTLSMILILWQIKLADAKPQQAIQSFNVIARCRVTVCVALTVNANPQFAKKQYQS
jgi:hypothetical protein